DGSWSFRPWMQERSEYHDKYMALLHKWNRTVTLFNAKIGQPSGTGRPLEASESQRAEVLRLRKAGASLRGIAEETNLGLRTVRTIIDRKHGTDRTSKRHEIRRIEINRQEETRRRVRERTR